MLMVCTLCNLDAVPPPERPLHGDEPSSEMRALRVLAFRVRPHGTANAPVGLIGGHELMSKNVAPWDRALRIIFGLALFAFVGPRATWGWLGLITFVTGLAGICPLYRMLGISTCSAPKPPSDASLPG
jgi:Protein of unknown function (DUF2892)